MPELPLSWREEPLGEVAEVRVSNVDKKSRPFELPVRLCNYLDVYREDYLDESHLYMVATATPSEVTRFGLRAGDVLVTKDSETPDDIGVATVIEAAPDDLVCGYHLAIVRPTPQLNPVWLAKQFGTTRVQRYLAARATGSTRYGLSNATLGNLPIVLPLRGEQDRIIEILRTLDEAIRDTEHLITKLQQMEQGLLHDMLTRGIDDNGELRDPLRHPGQFQNTAIGRIPRVWEVRSTVDAAARSAGSTTIGPFGSNLLASDYRREGVPVVFVRDIREDGFAWTSGVYVSATKAGSLSAHAVVPGDVVITKMGLPPCVAAVYPSWMPLGIVTADVIRLRPHPTEIRADWITAFLNSEPVRVQVRSITAGVTRPKVTLADFRKLQIAVPPVPEQDAILARVQASVERLRCEMYEVEKLRYLRLGLSNDVLAGRVRVSPLRNGDVA